MCRKPQLAYQCKLIRLALPKLYGVGIGDNPLGPTLSDPVHPDPLRAQTSQQVRRAIDCPFSDPGRARP